jgi:hypothetical protein
MKIPQSVVIVRHPRGWVAHIRFENPREDQDISAGSRWILNTKIDSFFGVAR